MDPFFEATACDRCHRELNGARTMSWFTTETICMSCKSDESEIKRAFIEAGRGSMEGCGYVPDVNTLKKEPA